MVMNMKSTSLVLLFIMMIMEIIQQMNRRWMVRRHFHIIFHLWRNLAGEADKNFFRKYMVKTIMKILYLLLLAVTLAYSLTFSQNYVAGYYPNWLLGTLPPQNIKYENLTHVIHAFAWPTSSGSIEMYSGMPSSQLIQSVHNAGKKIVLAF